MIESSSPIKRYWPYGIIAAVVIGALTPIAVTVFSLGDANTLGGDFPSFYVAGEIVLDGDIDHLYEPTVQQDRQAPYHSESGQYLYFAYPPFVAVAYAGVAWLPYPIAFAIHSLASLAALAVAASMVVKVLQPSMNPRREIVVITALALTSFPIATAVLGGQNTTYTLLLVLVAFAVTVSISNPVSGVAAGALFYKPQFGILVVLALAVGRKWQSMVWAGLTVFGLYLVGALSVGWRWPEEWVSDVASFGAQNQDINASLLVNIPGWFNSVIPGAPWVVAATVVFVTVPTLMSVYHNGVPSLVVGPVSAWLILAAASALFYDVGVALVVFGMFVVAAQGSRWLIPVAIGASWIQLLAPSLGWSPIFLVLLAMWGYEIVRMTRPIVSVSQSVSTLASPERQEPRM